MEFLYILKIWKPMIAFIQDMYATHFPRAGYLIISYASVTAEWGSTPCPGPWLPSAKLHFVFHYGGTFTI